MDKPLGSLGALLGGLAVAAGAFGAHGLRGRLSSEMLSAFETGARYQMYHALAVLAVAVLLERGATGAVRAAGWCCGILPGGTRRSASTSTTKTERSEVM